MIRLARGFLYVVMFFPFISYAAELGEARVGSGVGDLAVRESSHDSWRNVGAGSPLPAECELATSGGGPKTLQLPGSTLHLDANSRARLHAEKREIELQSGRVYLASEIGAPWKLSAIGARESTKVPGGSAVQLSFRAGGKPEVDWIRDGAKPGAKDGDAELVAWSREKPAQGLGQLVIKDSQAESPIRLNVARYHANVVLEPPVALVQIDQSFYNPYPRQEEGTFIFNLPRGASVSRFAMYVTPNDLIEGELIERDRANNIYTTIVNSRRDPAILEQIGDNLFRMRVFPIFPHDVKRILLDFTLPLEAEDGTCRFELPLLSDLAPIWDFRLQGRIAGPLRSDSVISSSHPKLSFGKSPGSVSFDLRERMYQPSSNFNVSFGVPEQESVSILAYRALPLPKPEVAAGQPAATADPWREREATYFLATLPPLEKAKVGKPDLPADVLIVADTSSGTRSRDLLRQNVQSIARQLPNDSRFRLACLDASFRSLGKEWLPPRGEAAEQALADFNDEFLLGATNLSAGLSDAAASFGTPDKSRRRVLVYVGDGIATAGTTQPVLLCDEVRKGLAAASVQFVAVDLGGNAAGRSLLESLAAEAEGAVFDGLAASGRKDLFRWLLAGLPPVPRIESLEIAGVAADDVHYPTHLLPGRAVRVYGRTAAATELEVKCRVRAGGKTTSHAWKLPVGAKQDDVFIGRLWAQRRLERLLRQKETHTFNEQVVKPLLIELSQEWSLLSPYTAFLVLETEADYQRWGIDRRLRRKYWKPEGQQDAIPLSPEWLIKIKADIISDEQREQYTAALAKAEQALAAHDFDTLAAHLRSVKALPQAKSDPRYAKLSEAATLGMRRQVQGRALWRDHIMFAPREAVQESLRQPGIAPLLLGWNAMGDERTGALEFGLSREVQTPRDEMPLKEFVSWLEGVTRLTIDLDRKSLADMRVKEGYLLQPVGRGRMSARALASHALRQLDLVLVQDEDRLLVTSPEVAESRLKTTLYAVEDLLQPERSTPRERLFPSAGLQRRLAIEQRLAEKLKQPISFDFRNDSLFTVVEGFAEALGENVVLDFKSLDGIGRDAKTPITSRSKNVPAYVAIDRALRDLELGFSVHDEAIVIGSQEAVWHHNTVQLHGGRGIVAMYPTVAVPQVGIPLWGRLRGQTPFVTSIIPLLDMRGGFGGMGGGIGGMGGMGGFGAGGAAISGGSRFTGGAGEDGGDQLSSGGEGLELPAPAAAAVDEGEQADRDKGPPRPDDQVAQPKTQLYEADFDTLIDTITRTITPTEWEDAGGAGAIDAFTPTLDLVVAGTWRQHFEIARLLAEMRKLPFEVAPGTGGELADPKKLGRHTPVNFDMFIDLITSTVWPTRWEDAGGAGAIEAAPNRLALVISADETVHEDVSRLLLLLRRSKHALGPHTYDWDRIDSGRILSGLGLTHLDRDLKATNLPEPRADELAALECRPAPADGAWTWRHSSGDPFPSFGELAAIDLRRSGNRLEFRQAEVTCRIDGEHAALSYPELGLVELGAWGEAARRALDDQLPWLPHRTNQELARMFEVAKTTGPDALLFYVRLVPAGSANPEGTYLRLGYSRIDRMLAHFESYVEGKLAARLAFANRAARGEQQIWRRISLLDAAGKEVGVWNLAEREPGPAADVPSLARDWPGQIVLDLRDKEPQVERDFHAAVAAIESRDWTRARARLNVLIEERPTLPLLRLLRAWCLDHEPGSREQMISDLVLVAESSSAQLTRFVADGGFVTLPPEGLYQVLSRYAPEILSLDDRERLARAALAAGNVERALEVIRDSLSAPLAVDGDAFDKTAGPPVLQVSPFESNDARFFERFKLFIDLLARLNRNDALGDLLGKFVTERNVGQVVSLADVLSVRNKRGLADAMLVKVLASRSISTEQRVALLRKRAELQPHEVQRGKLRAAAIGLLPAKSKARRAEGEALLADLSGALAPEVVAQIAELVSDRELRARLWLRQAELEERPEAAAELIWRAYLAGGLNGERTLWACERLNAAERPARVIRLCEARLRAEDSLSPHVLAELARAYRAAGKKSDAQRSEMQDPLPPAPRRPSPNVLGFGGFM